MNTAERRTQLDRNAKAMARSQNRPTYTESLGSLTSAQPKGRQLYAKLEALVSSLTPGSMLPSERVLADQFGVARMTVRQQIDELARAGLVIRVIGSGTFAAEPRLPIAPDLPSFSREIAAMGMTPGSQLLDVTTLSADETLAGVLGVKRGSPVVRLMRVRTADGIPLSIERTHFSLVRFPGLELAPFDRISLRDHLRDEYGCDVTRAERRFTIATLDEADAAHLTVPTGVAAFHAEVTTYDRDDKVVEAGTALLRADRYEIRMSVDGRLGGGQAGQAPQADA